MSFEQRQQWIFRLSLGAAALTAAPLVMQWSGLGLLRPATFLTLILCMLALGVPALVLGVQHARALARGEHRAPVPSRRSAVPYKPAPGRRTRRKP